jgi:hypothetical protein
MTTDASNNTFNNNQADDLDYDLVPIPEEMRLFIMTRYLMNNPGTLPLPEVFHYAKRVNNPTVFQTRPFHISATYSFLISLCDQERLVLTIQKKLNEIISINNLTYCDRSKQWKFNYGKPRKYLQSCHQIALYHAAVTAFEKFPPENLDVPDIIRISECKTVLGFYEDHSERLPYASFHLALWYNPEQKNIIINLEKTRNGESGDYLTAIFIKDKLNDALIEAGYDVSPYVKDKTIFKM